MYSSSPKPTMTAKKAGGKLGGGERLNRYPSHERMSHAHAAAVQSHQPTPQPRPTSSLAYHSHHASPQQSHASALGPGATLPSFGSSVLAGAAGSGPGGLGGSSGGFDSAQSSGVPSSNESSLASSLASTPLTQSPAVAPPHRLYSAHFASSSGVASPPPVAAVPAARPGSGPSAQLLGLQQQQAALFRHTNSSSPHSAGGGRISSRHPGGASGTPVGLAASMPQSHSRSNSEQGSGMRALAGMVSLSLLSPQAIARRAAATASASASASTSAAVSPPSSTLHTPPSSQRPSLSVPSAAAFGGGARQGQVETSRSELSHNSAVAEMEEMMRAEQSGPNSARSSQSQPHAYAYTTTAPSFHGASFPSHSHRRVSFSSAIGAGGGDEQHPPELPREDGMEHSSASEASVSRLSAYQSRSSNFLHPFSGGGAAAAGGRRSGEASYMEASASRADSRRHSSQLNPLEHEQYDEAEEGTETDRVVSVALGVRDEGDSDDEDGAPFPHFTSPTGPADRGAPLALQLRFPPPPPAQYGVDEPAIGSPLSHGSMSSSSSSHAARLAAHSQRVAQRSHLGDAASGNALNPFAATGASVSAAAAAGTGGSVTPIPVPLSVSGVRKYHVPTAHHPLQAMPGLDRSGVGGGGVVAASSTALPSASRGLISPKSRAAGGSSLPAPFGFASGGTSPPGRGPAGPLVDVLSPASRMVSNTWMHAPGYSGNSSSSNSSGSGFSGTASPLPFPSALEAVLARPLKLPVGKAVVSAAAPPEFRMQLPGMADSFTSPPPPLPFPLHSPGDVDAPSMLLPNLGMRGDGHGHGQVRLADASAPLFQHTSPRRAHMIPQSGVLSPPNISPPSSASREVHRPPPLILRSQLSDGGGMGDSGMGGGAVGLLACAPLQRALSERSQLRLEGSVPITIHASPGPSPMSPGTPQRQHTGGSGTTHTGTRSTTHHTPVRTQPREARGHPQAHAPHLGTSTPTSHSYPRA